MIGAASPGQAAILLAALDAALTAEAEAPRSAGMAAAIALHGLLAAHRLVWDDVVAPGSRLAKLCGCLGSAYAGEQSAAYDHAVRLIRRRRTTWSAQLRLPDHLRVSVAPMARKDNVPMARNNDAPTAHANLVRPPGPGTLHHVDDTIATPTAHIVSPPEADWTITIQLLRARGLWPTDMDPLRLAALEQHLAVGPDLGEDDARWLRDLWWWAELNDTSALGQT